MLTMNVLGEWKEKNNGENFGMAFAYIMVMKAYKNLI